MSSQLLAAVSTGVVGSWNNWQYRQSPWKVYCGVINSSNNPSPALYSCLKIYTRRWKPGHLSSAVELHCEVTAQHITGTESFPIAASPAVILLLFFPHNRSAFVDVTALLLLWFNVPGKTSQYLPPWSRWTSGPAGFHWVSICALSFLSAALCVFFVYFYWINHFNSSVYAFCHSHTLWGGKLHPLKYYWWWSLRCFLVLILGVLHW